MESPISVRSEVGKLKTVLLHRPGSADLSKRYPEENVIVG